MVGETLRNLLTIAWLLPLAGFAVEIFGGFWGTRKSRLAAWMSVCCIATGFVCSASALICCFVNRRVRSTSAATKTSVVESTGDAM